MALKYFSMSSKNIIQIQHYNSPCGELLLGSYYGCLCLCDWGVGYQRDFVANRLQQSLYADFLEDSSEVTQEAAKQLDEYFANERVSFDLPLLFVGTDFQKLVWHKLLAIPYCSTVSYSVLAHQIGHPTAVRAVANANRANALSIFVPCHRVIGANNLLTGYAGGLQAKKFLLDLESSMPTLF